MRPTLHCRSTGDTWEAQAWWERPTKGVLASYSSCIKEGNRHVKTFANPKMIRQITNGHYQHYLHNLRAVNVRKEEVDGPWK